MQPYQTASEEMLRQSNEPGKLLYSAGKTAGSIAVGSHVLNRIMPLLNSFVPSNIAAKGLEKIDPRFGKFIKGAEKQGFSLTDALNFIQEKTVTEESNHQQDKAKESRNVIEQYSPELDSFIKTKLNEGKTAIEAGAIAQAMKKFDKDIKKITKDHKSDWSAILQSVYGSAQQPMQPQTQQMQQPAQQPQSKAALQGQQAQGAGDTALIAAMQKILSM